MATENSNPPPCSGKCGRRVGRRAGHATVCNKGPSQRRAYTALERTLGSLLREAGANVDLEMTVPELLEALPKGEAREAIMDLVVWWPGSTHCHLIDVTIRSPHAERYLPRASRDPLHTADMGDKDKANRYGPTVRALSWTSYGRLSSLGTQLLLDRAKDAVNFARCDAAPLSAAMLANRWRQCLERVVWWCTVDTVMHCLGGAAVSVVRSRRRRSPSEGDGRRQRRRIESPPGVSGGGAAETGVAGPTATRSRPEPRWTAGGA